MERYKWFIRLVMKSAPSVVLNFPKESTEEIFKIYNDVVESKYLNDYGIILDYSFLDGKLSIKKIPTITKELLQRFPQIDTLGKLEFVLKHVELFKQYERPLEIRKRFDSGGDIEES